MALIAIFSLGYHVWPSVRLDIYLVWAVLTLKYDWAFVCLPVYRTQAKQAMVGVSHGN